MPTAYPTSPMWSYPATRALAFETRIVAAVNGTEQRWSVHAGRESLDLSYPRLTLAQRDTMLSFFDACKGAFTQDIQVTIGGVTLSNLFLGDRISVVERSGGRWELRVTLEQVSRPPDTGTLATDFPVLSTGARVQLPYTQERDFETRSAQSEGGRFVWYDRAATRRSWIWTAGCITDAEMQAIWDHFSRARGRWGSFGFTDPDSGTRYASTRFSEDRLEWRMLGVDHNATEVKLIQAL